MNQCWPSRRFADSFCDDSLVVMKHIDTNVPSLPPFRITLGLVVALLVWIVGAAPALSQPTQIEDTFSSSYSYVETIGEWDQGGSEELCFEVQTAIDFDQVACTSGSTVKQVSNLGPGGADIREITSFQGDLYFSADGGPEGWEVYRYNGTSVTQVTSLQPASGSAFPTDFVVYDGALYFSAKGSAGREIYRYTGTTVERVTTISGANVNPEELLVHDGELYFVGKRPSTLFSYDGTTLDQKADIRSDGFDPRIRDLASYNGALFFSADAGNGNGRQVIRYDGSTYQEVVVTNPGGGKKAPAGLTSYDGYLFYSANTSDGRELFRYTEDSQPTESPLTVIDAQNSSPRNITGYGGNIYFTTPDGTNGRELYSIPAGGFANSTRIDLRPGPKDSDPNNLTVHDGDLYFEATVGDATSDRSVLHRYDGSSISIIRSPNNFASQGQGTFESEKVVYDGDVYFTRNSPSVGQELFRSDGSTVELVEDLRPGTDGSFIGNLVAYNGDLYFRAITSSTGFELYHYNGSSVSVAADIVSGSDGSTPVGLTVYNGFLYFSAEDANQDRELYRFSPSTGAQLVENINTTGSAFQPFQFRSSLQVYDGDLYFVAKTDASGVELFRSSGLSATRITNINGGSADSFPGALTVYDGVLYFTAENGTDGQELYGYNASSDAVQQIEALNPSGDGLSRFGEMVVYDGSLYFEGDDGSTGNELFQYDGFTVSLVQDIASGDADSVPRDFAVYNSRLYFTAMTPDRGREPHSFDGQTVRSNEIADGPVSGGGTDPVVYDDGNGPRLFVTATDNVTGIELYAFTESDGPLPVELARLDATMDGPSVNLVWTTASETGNAGFEVQRQPASGTSWTNLGSVEGSGTTNHPTTYRFEDDDLPFGVDTFHYRLRQVDTDGTTHLSKAVTISRGIVDQVEIRETYPNPTTGRARAALTIPTGAEEARLEIFDMLGRSVQTVATNIESGRTTQTVDVSGLSSGVYFLRLYTDGETSTQKFTVVR